MCGPTNISRPGSICLAFRGLGRALRTGTGSAAAAVPNHGSKDMKLLHSFHVRTSCCAGRSKYEEGQTWLRNDEDVSRVRGPEPYRAMS